MKRRRAVTGAEQTDPYGQRRRKSEIDGQSGRERRSNGGFDAAPFAQVRMFRGERKLVNGKEGERRRVMRAKNVAVGQKVE